MRIEVNAKVILTAQGFEGAPLDPELKAEDIVFTAEQLLNGLPSLYYIYGEPRGLVAKAQYGIRVHMNEITQVTE